MKIHHATPFLLSASLFFGLGAVATAASDGSTHASGASPPSTQHRTPQATQGSGKPQNPGTIRGFNPQPEPPGHSGPENPGTTHGFNPQPEPPGHGGPENPGTTHGFNPQPEPPGTPAAPAAGPQ